MSLNFWRETWWCWSMVETFLNTHMTRLSCSYEPAESHTPENWHCSSDVKVSMHLWEKSAEAAQALSVSSDCHVSLNFNDSLEPSLYSRSWPGGTPPAITSRPHTHRPTTGRQAAVTQSVGAGHDTGGINETAGERNSVWHTVFSFWGI